MFNDLQLFPRRHFCVTVYIGIIWDVGWLPFLYYLQCKNCNLWSLCRAYGKCLFSVAEAILSQWISYCNKMAYVEACSQGLWGGLYQIWKQINTLDASLFTQLSIRANPVVEDSFICFCTVSSYLWKSCIFPSLLLYNVRGH